MGLRRHGRLHLRPQRLRPLAARRRPRGAARSRLDRDARPWHPRRHRPRYDRCLVRRLPAVGPPRDGRAAPARHRARSQTASPSPAPSPSASARRSPPPSRGPPTSGRSSCPTASS
jgi:hypothetical protein